MKISRSYTRTAEKKIAVDSEFDQYRYLFLVISLLKMRSRKIMGRNQSHKKSNVVA